MVMRESARNDCDQESAIQGRRLLVAQCAFFPSFGAKRVTLSESPLRTEASFLLADLCIGQITLCNTNRSIAI